MVKIMHCSSRESEFNQSPALIASGLGHLITLATGYLVLPSRLQRHVHSAHLPAPVHMRGHTHLKIKIDK